MIRPENPPEIPGSDRIKALLSHDDWWASLTPEEKERQEKRRAVFGSSDVAHEMNRRGL